MAARTFAPGTEPLINRYTEFAHEVASAQVGPGPATQGRPKLTADNTPESGSHDDHLEALLDDLDMTPIPETVEEVLASLDDLPGVAFDPPSAPNAIPGWLTDAQEYALKYGPFSTDQIVLIIRALNAVSDPRVESGQ